MPVGPLALMDETSQELGYKIMKSAQEEMGDNYRETGTEDLLDKFVNELGRKGRKSGGGFYEYPEDGGKKYIWPGLKEHYPLAKEQPSPEEVEQRLLYIQLAYVAECYANDVVHDPQSADLGAIFGWGFAPWTGGPMSHIDTIGVEEYVRIADALAQQHGERYAPPASFRKKAEEGGKFYAAA